MIKNKWQVIGSVPAISLILSKVNGLNTYNQCHEMKKGRYQCRIHKYLNGINNSMPVSFTVQIRVSQTMTNKPNLAHCLFFVNKDLLEHIYAHLLTYYLWLFTHHNSKVE